MKFFLIAIIILSGFSCTKERLNNQDTKTTNISGKCGILMVTPVLDSFVYPTYYITAIVAFPEGNKTVHFHDDVTGDHDNSWFLPKYSKDSTLCIAP